MPYVLAAVAVVALVWLVVAAVRGRLAVRSCCAPSDPARDLRMRSAYGEDGRAAPTEGD